VAVTSHRLFNPTPSEAELAPGYCPLPFQGRCRIATGHLVSGSDTESELGIVRGKKRAGGAEDSSPGQAKRCPGFKGRKPGALEGRQMNLASGKHNSKQAVCPPNSIHSIPNCLVGKSKVE
jgi:hypothetical protein